MKSDFWSDLQSASTFLSITITIVAVCGQPGLYDNISTVLHRDRTNKELPWRQVTEKVRLPGKLGLSTAQLWSIRTPFREQAIKTFACRLADRRDKTWLQAFYKAALGCCYFIPPFDPFIAVRFLCAYAKQRQLFSLRLVWKWHKAYQQWSDKTKTRMHLFIGSQRTSRYCYMPWVLNKVWMFFPYPAVRHFWPSSLIPSTWN